MNLKSYLFLFLTFLIFSSCGKVVKNPVRNTGGNNAGSGGGSVNTGDSLGVHGNPMVNIDVEDPNITYMYFRDTLEISKILKSNETGFTVADNVFKSVGDKLFIEKPNQIDKTNFDVTIKDKNNDVVKILKIKVRCWIKNAYQLVEYETLPAQPFYIYTYANTTYRFENDNLYVINYGGVKQLMCPFKLEDPMYNQMIILDDYYVVRTGTKIFVSRDLKNWKLVYDYKRGIRESMVLLNGADGYELLFCEYTPGLIFERHYVRSYSFTKDTVTDRKIFYANGEKLKPRARHSHILVKDPYSNMIFLGNGDGDDESAIYYSVDNGHNFTRLGGDTQLWRSLAIIFTPTAILWNTDRSTPQYLNKLDRKYIRENVPVSLVERTPLINSAHWCTERIAALDGYLMSSNSEGAIYDDNYRVYFIKIIKDVPVVYEAYSNKEGSIYTQMFPLGQDNEGYIYLKNLRSNDIKKCKVAKVDKTTLLTAN